MAAQHPETQTPTRTKVVIATSVMLSFISFWRAAAIVLNDLGSSAYYVGGIAEQAVGPAAPWFIFGVMLFSYAVRAVYVESCAMFTRGGVYRVVKEAMGGTLAKLSVSALMFDYVLTGPISGVSAGQYIVGLAAQTTTYFGHPWSPDKETVNLLAAGIAILITVYFWWRNTKGIHESSNDALRIMYVTTVMVVLMILWSTVTILTQPDKQRLPPAPTPAHLSFNSDAVGWMPQIAPRSFLAQKSEAPRADAHLRQRPKTQERAEVRLGPKGRDAARPHRHPDRLWSFGPRHVGRGDRSRRSTGSSNTRSTRTSCGRASSSSSTRSSLPPSSPSSPTRSSPTPPARSTSTT